MTNGNAASAASRLWQAPDGLHIDVRGLACPEPMVSVLRLIDGGEAGEVLFAHLSQEPLLLYPELDDRGWRYRLIAPSDEKALPDGEVVLAITRPRP
uniref:UPF0033 domain-containing protein n=1 Tax=Rhodopseudomonas palustris (strain BisA53) TaxID=316055 RepID=Q07M31_RHOP5